MSPGNLYRYFPSKEAIIAGIAERDRAEVAQEFASVDLSHGFFAVLEGMAQHHFAERTDEQVKLCTEIMSEAGAIRRSRAFRRRSTPTCKRWLVDAVAARRPNAATFPRDIDFDAAATMLMIIADGVWWRRALDPNFEPEAMLPIFMDITRHMLRGRARETRLGSEEKTNESEPHHRGRPGGRRRAVDRVRAFASARNAESRAALNPGEPAAQKPFRVAVIDTNVVPHQPQAAAVGPHRGRPQGHRRGAHRRRADRAPRPARQPRREGR